MLAELLSSFLEEVLYKYSTRLNDTFILRGRLIVVYIRAMSVMWLIEGYDCERHNNPPDFFLDVINGDVEISPLFMRIKGHSVHFLLLLFYLLIYFIIIHTLLDHRQLLQYKQNIYPISCIVHKILACYNSE